MIPSLDAQGFPVRNGRTMDLPPKERAVLALLIRRWPQVVSKQEFADAAWGGREMSDESLARCVSRLRAAFADATGPRIESVYGAGYRLDAGASAAASHARLSSALLAPPQAVEAFLHARLLAHQRTPAAMARALAVLRRLIEQHPHYAAARIAFAEAAGGAAGWALDPATGLVEEGLHQLDEAERLAPQSFGLATARAHLLDCAWRYREARVAWATALQQAQNDPDSLFLHGRFLLVTGDAVAAVAQLQAAVRLHPYSALVRITLARALAHAGDVEAAIAEAQSTCDAHPESMLAATYRLALDAWARPAPAVARAAWAAAEQPDAPPIALSVFAFALARTGRADEAREVVDNALACSTMTPCGAVLYAATLVELGDTARAIALLTAAEQAHCAVLPMTLRDPANAGLTGLPDFVGLMARVFGSNVSLDASRKA